MLKNKRGITLVTLTITIIVLIILASVTTYTGVNTIKNARYYNSVAEIKAMKTKVDEMYEDYQNGDEVVKIAILNQGESTDTKATELSKAYYVASQNNMSGEDLGNEEEYRYYSNDYIKTNLGLDGIDRDFFINIKARSVLLVEGIEYQNETYYALCQIEGEQFSVKYVPEKIQNMPEGWVKANKNNYGNDWYAYRDTDGNIAKVNAPMLAEGMIPIKYVGEEGMSDSEIEELTTGAKWANAMTKDGSMWVWVPRYAYSIVNNYQTSNTESVATTNARSTKNIDIKFLVGTTNKDRNGTIYATDYDPNTEVINGVTTMIVHPAFRLGDRELTGIWVAKFEASGTKTVEVDGENVEVAVGNHTNGTTLVEPETTTPVKSIPNAISWRNLTIGESEYRCMQMGSNTEVYGWKNVNAHLIRNSEWGAVAYLCYSKYGSVPMINGCGNSENKWYDLYTGMGPISSSSEVRYDATARSGHEYNTVNGILASTTGNVYGVYDMSGGAMERVAAYLNNGNNNLNTYGKSTTDSSVKYFEGGNLKLEYSALWESYQVGEEEKNNAIAVEGEGYLTQVQLWGKYGSTYTDTDVNQKYNTARKRITDQFFSLLANIKGVGINEISGELEGNVLTKTHSYYGVFSNGSYGWLLNEFDTTSNYARAWNTDNVFIGHASSPYIYRGGRISGATGAGVLYSSAGIGNSNDYTGFRPVVCP